MMMAQDETTPRLMLVGFEEVFFHAFCRAGLQPVVWVRQGRGGQVEKLGSTTVYRHSALKFAEVQPVFRKDLPSGLAQKVFDRSYPLFLRNLNKRERCKWRYGTSWMDKVNRLRIMIFFFYDMLTKHEITHIIFSSPPHGGANIALHFLAREMGIPSLFVTMSAFDNRHFIVADYEDIGWFRTTIKGEVDPQIRAEERPRTPFYMNINIPGHYNPKESALKTGLRLGGRVLEVIYHAGRQVLGLRNKYVEKTRLLCTDYDRVKLAAKWKRMHFDASLLERRFVYFPLHFQPELSCEILGGDYADQISAIEEMRRVLPDDVCILVKENPLQSAFAREESFFARLKAMPNTHYVLPHVDTFLLIERSLAVATLVGTAGWEALQMGKPVICFGYAWYRSLPGVFNWTDDFDWKKVEAFTFDRKKLQAALRELSRVFRPGITDTKVFSLRVPNFDPRRNADLIVQSVKEYL